MAWEDKYMETPRILVIDDEKEICDLIEIYLSQEGYPC